jgi:hypothetical protein
MQLCWIRQLWILSKAPGPYQPLNAILTAHSSRQLIDCTLLNISLIDCVLDYPFTIFGTALDLPPDNIVRYIFLLSIHFYNCAVSHSHRCLSQFHVGSGFHRFANVELSRSSRLFYRKIRSRQFHFHSAALLTSAFPALISCSHLYVVCPSAGHASTLRPINTYCTDRVPLFISRH